MQRETQTGRNVVAYLPATAVDRRRQAVGGPRRALRPSRTRRARQLARRQEEPGGFTTAPTTTRRARRRSWRSPKRCRTNRAGATCCWLLVGEEIGLIGSNAFVNKPPVPVDQLAAYLNFDMVGRMVDNKLTVQATGTSPVWADPRAGQRGRRLRSRAAARSVSADRRRQLQRRRAVAELLHEHAHRLSPSRRHRRQDQLRGSRSRRRVRGGDRQADRRHA